VKRIYKYWLGGDPGVVRHLMHAGARILTVQLQGSAIAVWAVIDDAVVEREENIFRIAGTGHACEFFDDGGAWRHVGTVQVPARGKSITDEVPSGSILVWHVFHRIRDLPPHEIETKKSSAGCVA